jgi:hypothetical protein
MLSMKSVLKVTISGKDYEFNCAPDSPLPDAIEAHSQFGAFLLGKQEQNKVAQAAQTSVETQIPADEQNVEQRTEK